MNVFYLKYYHIDEEKLENLLPSGSGFDTRPEISFGNNHIKVCMDWHLMEDGMYKGYIPFSLYIYLDQKREGQWRVVFNTNRKGRHAVEKHDLRTYINDTFMYKIGEGPSLIESILTDEGRLEYDEAVIAAVKKRAKPLMTHYHSDLEIDLQVIEKHPYRCPFVHITRKMGTHMFPHTPASMYPKKGEVVPYLFGKADRDHILKSSSIESFKHHIETANYIQMNYFDGFTYDIVEPSNAMRNVRKYYEKMREDFLWMP